MTKNHGLSFMTTRTIGLALFIAPIVSSAQPTWKRVFGGNGVEQVWAVEALADGGFVVLGSTGSFGAASSDVYILRLDQDGERVWSRILGTPLVDDGRGVVELGNGDIVIAGLTNGGDQGGYDGLVMRLDQNGGLLWQRTYGTSDWEMLYAVADDGSGGVWAAGTTYGLGIGGDQWLLHLNDQGDELINTSIGTVREETASSVKATPDGGCVLAGTQVTEQGDMDVVLVKVAADGSEQWSRTFGGPEDDAARDVETTLDGGFSTVGWTRSYNPVVEQFQVRWDAGGNYLWHRNWGQVDDQEGFDHIELASGEFASIGYVSQGGAGGKDMFLLKNTSNGDFILGQTQGGVEDDLGRAIARAEGGFVICGVTRSYGQGQGDVMVVRTNEIGFTDSDEVLVEFDPVNIPELRTPPPATIFPNPCTNVFTLRDVPPGALTVFDAHGRVVLAAPWIVAGVPVPVALEAGLYVVEVRDAAGVIQRSPLVIAGE
jgi:hypothetical protein